MFKTLDSPRDLPFKMNALFIALLTSLARASDVNADVAFRLQSVAHAV